MILLFSLVAWLTTTAASPDGPNWETTFLIAIFTVIAWRRPDRYGPALLITLHVFYWILIGKPSFLTLTALAVAIIAIHQAAAVTDTIGTIRHMPARLLRRWALRIIVIVATTPGVFWLAATRAPISRGAPILLGAALLALALTGWWLSLIPEGARSALTRQTDRRTRARRGSSL